MPGKDHASHAAPPPAVLETGPPVMRDHALYLNKDLLIKIFSKGKDKM
jgi:hypothetical protein